MKVLLLLVALLLTACGGSGKVDVMFECPSPSGKKIATLFRVSYGDNPLYHEMHISMRDAGSDFDDDLPIFSFKHGYDAVIRWQADDAMRIEYPEDSELTHQEMVIFGTSQTFSTTDTIRVIYQQNPSTHGYFMVEQRCFNTMSEPTTGRI